jgi:hypothetical protein
MAEGTATMVPGYRHLPGNHCGSTALRNLLAFHGAEVSEEMALGLGAGACFYYIAIDGQSPSRFTNGRTSRLEEEFLALTGAPLRLETDEDPERAWAMAKAVVDSGRPAILLTDLYHLDHYGKSAHFPGHAVVLAGYDDEVAYLSDTGFEELQTTRLENLALARHEGNPIFPLAGHMLHVPDGEGIGDLSEPAPRAIARAAERMIDPPLGEMRIGFAAAAVMSLLLPVPEVVAVLGVCVVLAELTLALCWTPAMAFLSDAAERIAVGQWFAFALVNLAWAGGQVAGGSGGGAVADATSDAVPFAIAAALLALTAAAVARRSATERATAPVPEYAEV